MNKKAANEHPSELSIEDYDYELPDARIAKYPLSERDRSKLLIYKEGEISQKMFADLPSLLNPNDCLVFNDTRVVHARVPFQRNTGAHIEVFCLEPLEPAEVSEAFSCKKSTVWKAMLGNGKRWKIGELLKRNIESKDGSYTLSVELCSKGQDAYVVRFSWDYDISFAEVLDAAGELPIPPYLNRETEAEDEERYQTVYAQADGSVAAPTAGLHFTQTVFDELKRREVQPLFVTLHVGAGTFKPVKSETMKDHQMHRERILVSIKAVEKMRASANDNRIIAVGTTSLRTIESIYWFGVKLLAGRQMKELFVGQWEPYELSDENVEVSAALDAVLEWMSKNERIYVNAFTELLIAPGYQIRMADGLITNFHQPKSTLLLLVSVFIGNDWRKVYDYALENEFRFLSFGDSSMLFKA